ncbi:MAG: WD40 repeat domain-containing protein [Chloroflexi bacterium]|nr:WD40 repeat domain-containing protein [Chloroflexota bacterium]
MIKHRSPISGVDAYKDLVATAGYDNQLILWDARVKQSLTRVCHDHLVNQCRFSADGRLLVTASSDYTARVWAVPSMQIVSVLTGHDDDVEMAVFNPDATRVATASRDFRVRVFDRGGRLEHTMCGHTADVISVEFIKDGREIVSSSDDGTVRRWSAESGELLETIDLGGIETDTIVYDERGVLYVGNDEGAVVIIRDGRMQTVHAHQSGIKRLVFEPARRVLLSASYDRTVKLWDVREDGGLALTHTADVPAVVWLRTAAFAGPTKLVFGSFGSAYIGYDLEQKQWDLDKVEDTLGVNAVRVVDGATYTIGDAGVVTKGGVPLASMGSLCNFLGGFRGRVVTGGQMGILFDASTGEALHQHWSPLNCCATFMRNGEEHLIVGAYTGEGLIFRENADGRLEHVTTMRLHDNAVKGVACNDTHIFSVCATGAAAFHDIATLDCARRILDAHEKIANGAACLADGRFVSVSRDRKLRLWTIDSCEVMPTPHDHSVKCVAAGPHDSLVATGSYDGKVALYDWRKGAWAHLERPTVFGVSSVACSETPNEFLASSYDGQVYRVKAT